MLTLLTSSVEGYSLGQKGAVLANYVEFKEFIKDKETGDIKGAVLVDKINGDKIRVKCKVVVNCTGVHSDEIRKLNDDKVKDRIVSSRGTHLVLEKGLLPDNNGILIPDTKDGRLIFMLPYNGYTLVGTTDDKEEPTHFPKSQEKDVEFLKNELKRVLGSDFDFDKSIKAVWSGQRPLVLEDPEENKNNEPSGIIEKMLHFFTPKNQHLDETKNISRKHVIEDT